ncbi:MAG: uroporphyrinogen decarboxylase family protein [Lachnospiraceae bacterium]|nr:uroporphyrinogen decarboxylase family protein [Lachnospiraceae bacterium]
MNSLERVTMVLNHQEPDRIPVYPLINSISRKYTGIDYAEWTLNEEKCAESILKATEELDVDIICTLVDLSVEAADWGMEMNYPTDKAASPVHDKKFVSTPEEYEKVVVLDPTKTPRMSGHIKLAKMLSDAKGKEKPIVGFVFGPLGILSMLRGLDNLFVDIFMNPEPIKQALENITETITRFSLELLDAGCHAIMYDTLYASKTILSPEWWDEWEGVYIEKVCNAVREHGGMVMLHNCGDGLYVADQIRRMKPVAISLQHLPPDCESMAEFKEKYGQEITIIGHVDPGFLMTASEEDIIAQCREQIDAYKKDGGYILATGCEYPAPLDDHFARVMINEAKTYGAYDK